MTLNAIKTHWLFQAVESGLSSYMDLFIMTDNDGKILYVAINVESFWIRQK